MSKSLIVVIALLSAMSQTVVVEARTPNQPPPPVTPGKWLGKTSPEGKATRPRVRHKLPPFDEPCSPTSVRFKNGCAEIVESTYLDGSGMVRTVPGLPPGYRIAQTMQFSWMECKKARLEGTRVDADAHIVCLE